MIIDAISGVTVALERGCVVPQVHTRWQRRSRLYDWPSLIRSEYFTMRKAVPVDANELRNGNPTGTLKHGGGPWPSRYGAVSGAADTIVVTFPRGPYVNGSCGDHQVGRWIMPLVPHVPYSQVVERFRQVAQSVHIVQTSPLPQGIRDRVVVHARRGDMLQPDHVTAHGGLPLLKRVYGAAIGYLLAHRRAAYLATDDPGWGQEYANRLRAAGVDTLFNPKATTSDDLRAMMAAKEVVLAGLHSKFSTLASLLAGVPLVHFATAEAMRAFANGSAAARTNPLRFALPWVADRLLNLTVVDVDAFPIARASITDRTASAADTAAAAPDGTVEASPAKPSVTNAGDGFRAIEVYIGRAQAKAARMGTHERIVNRRDVRVDRQGTWHAQSGQDRTIAQLHAHKRGGFFVDLASNEPLHLSNTRHLERDLGWRGVCIDASAELLLKSATYRTCQLVQAVVTDQSDRRVTFTTPMSTAMSNNAHDMKASGFGSIVGVGQVSKAAGSQPKVPTGWKEEHHTTISLGDLLEHVRAPRVIEYLSLDVEGAEESVLGAAFAFERFTFLSITVERPSAVLRERLRAHSYLFVGEHGCYGDQLWVHQSFAAQTQRVLGLKHALDPSRDGGEELWFGNCSAKGQPNEHLLHAHDV